MFSGFYQVILAPADVRAPKTGYHYRYYNKALITSDIYVLIKYEALFECRITIDGIGTVV